MAQLRLQDTVLFAQVQDDLVLFMLAPRKDTTKSCTGSTVPILRNCRARLSDTRVSLPPASELVFARLRLRSTRSEWRRIPARESVLVVSQRYHRIDQRGAPGGNV